MKPLGLKFRSGGCKKALYAIVSVFIFAGYPISAHAQSQESIQTVRQLVKDITHRPTGIQPERNFNTPTFERRLSAPHQILERIAQRRESVSSKNIAFKAQRSHVIDPALEAKKILEASGGQISSKDIEKFHKKITQNIDQKMARAIGFNERFIVKSIDQGAFKKQLEKRVEKITQNTAEKRKQEKEIARVFFSNETLTPGLSIKHALVDKQIDRKRGGKKVATTNQGKGKTVSAAATTKNGSGSKANKDKDKDKDKKDK